MRNRRNGLLVCAGSGDVKNIGDYIQSVAQEQFYDRIDTYVEREDLDVFSSDEKTNVIMNAWFMWNPEHFHLLHLSIRCLYPCTLFRA